jgi:hypothetical protein
LHKLKRLKKSLNSNASQEPLLVEEGPAHWLIPKVDRHNCRQV